MSTPRALQIGDTVYRMDEISWVKFQRLTLLEQVARWSLVAAGVLFFLMVAQGKQSMVNIEGLIGLFSLIAGLQIAAGNRIASSGDIEETYYEHRIRATPGQIGPRLKEHNPDMLELSSSQQGYHYYVQASRVAWCSPWSSINWSPLWLILIFGVYFAILANDLQLPQVKPFDQVELFRYKSGLGAVKFLALVNIVLAVVAIVASFKTGLRLSAVGGLSDGLPLTLADRQKLVSYLINAGSENKRSENVSAAGLLPATTTPATQETPEPVPQPQT
ncbi:hypothetical protein DYH09_24930 [bacterium CPR1]|nr:hypothetical protein [bacterium CPR1]